MKRLIYLIVFGLVITACGNRSNTLTSKDNEFKIKDTASIDKIFLANKGNQSVTLVKDGKRWMVNNEFEARGDMMANILHAIRNVEVKQFVPKTAIDNTMKLLSVSATKVEIYTNGKLAKVYYVGGPTQDHFGTYMVMQDSETPYICYVPGHRGYISTFYTPMADEWRSRQVFRYQLDEIASVKMEFYRVPQLSWEIINLDNKSFKLKSLSTNKYIEPFDTGAIKMILKEFKALGFESFVDINSTRLDSVKAKYPLYKITVTDRAGIKRTLDLYEIPMQPGVYTMDGKEAKVDVDRMYGIVDGKTTTICQYYTYDPVAVPITFFMGDKPVDAGYPNR
jgi:hypothetical protein